MDKKSLWFNNALFMIAILVLALLFHPVRDKRYDRAFEKWMEQYTCKYEIKNISRSSGETTFFCVTTDTAQIDFTVCCLPDSKKAAIFALADEQIVVTDDLSGAIERHFSAEPGTINADAETIDEVAEEMYVATKKAEELFDEYGILLQPTLKFKVTRNGQESVIEVNRADWTEIGQMLEDLWQ